LERVSLPAAAVVLTSIQPFTTAIMQSRLDWFKHQWIWNKNNSAGFANIRNKPLSTCEDVLVFSIGGAKLAVYNPQKEIRGEQRNKRGGRKSDNYHADPRKANNSFNNEYWPKMLLNQFGKANGTRREREHSTQKPTALLEYLIRTYTNPGDMILDPTAGSGTTAIAAINTRRKFVCIEKDPKIFEIARRRVEQRINRVDFGIIQS
jgi:site-specific DNA-methyltransferase (adenine-specific)